MRRCPNCSGPSGVQNSRENEDTVRRRRFCRVCGHVWTTFEVSFEQYRTLKNQDRLVAEVSSFLDRLRTKPQPFVRKDSK